MPLDSQIIFLGFQSREIFTCPYPEIRLPVLHIRFKVGQRLAHPFLHIQCILPLRPRIHLNGVTINSTPAKVLFMDTVEDYVHLFVDSVTRGNVAISPDPLFRMPGRLRRRRIRRNRRLGPPHGEILRILSCTSRGACRCRAFCASEHDYESKKENDELAHIIQ